MSLMRNISSLFLVLWATVAGAQTILPAGGSGGGGSGTVSASACGSGPTIAANSNNAGGSVTVGSSTGACTLTFSVPYTSRAFCVLSSADMITAATITDYYISAQSVSAFTIASATGELSTAKFNYVCTGA
jgi:hypothetical protein